MRAEESERPQSTVAIIIPAYNAAPFVAETITSALAQEEVDQVIVVDDGSTDATPQILASIRHDKLNIIATPNRGVSAARNTGLAHATANWVMFLDADDILAPGALSRLLARAAEQPGCVAAYGRCDHFGPDERRHTFGNWLRRIGRRPSGDVLEKLVAKSFISTTGLVVVKRAIANEVGGFDTGLQVGEDWEFFCRIATSGSFAFVGGPSVLRYRRHNASAMYRLGRANDAHARTEHAVFANPDITRRLGSRLAVMLDRHRGAASAVKMVECLRQSDRREGLDLLTASIGLDPWNAPNYLVRAALALVEGARRPYSDPDQS